MPDFRYRSINGAGRSVTGVATASDEASLAALLADEGLVLVEAELDSGEKGATVSARAPSAAASRTVKRVELIRFTYNLQAIISAGVPIVKGLESLREEAEVAESPMQPVLTGLIQRLRAGDSFSEALHLYPEVFPELYVNLIAAGEVSGNLEPILVDLAENLEWQEEIKGTLKQATVYPAVVLTAVAGLIAMIFLFVVPQFSELFQKMNVPLPLPTRILLGAGDLFARYWMLAAAFLAGGVFVLKALAKTPHGRLWVEMAKVRLPLFGPVVMKISLSRFSKNLSVLTNAGIPITEALLIAERVAGNPIVEKAVAEVRERVVRGEPLAKAMGSASAFPVLVRNMVAVGEESGKLSTSLARISQFYDREVKSGLKRAFSILEPAITVFLAALVGGIAVAIISALYKAITAVGKS